MTEQEEKVIESMANVGYEAMFEDKWSDLSENSVERALWLIVASRMLNELRRLWEVKKDSD